MEIYFQGLKQIAPASLKLWERFKKQKWRMISNVLK
jgi:hypothetical protein